MGFLDGFLGGVVKQRDTISQQNREDSQASQAREDAILQHLLTSDDPEIKAHAVAGMLESANPKRKKGGFAGWLGQNEANPQMQKIRDLVAQDQAVGHHVPTEVATQAGQHTAAGNASMGVAITTAAAAGSPAGDPQTGSGAPAGGAAPKPPTMITRAAPEAGGPSGSLAQPGGKSLTEVGSAPPPPTETAPSPDQPAPPVKPEMFSAASPSAVMGQAAPPAVSASPAPAVAPEAAAGAPPPAAAVAGAASPTAVLGQQAPPPVTAGKAPATPIGAGPLSPRGDVFRTPETQARKTKTATAQGDVEGEMAGLVSAGFTEPEARSIIKEKMARGTRAGAASGYQSIPGEVVGPDGKTRRVFAAFSREHGGYIGTDPEDDYYGIPIPGFQPRATGSTLTPAEAAERATAVTNARGQAASTIPLSSAQRATQTEVLSKDWQKIQAPLREMQRQHQLMVTGLNRFREGDKIGGSQAVLVTFQKILDPTSVVRESEYARSGQGLGLAQRIEGYIERLKEGGAGVPDPELAAMVETGRQFLTGMEGWNDQQKARIGAQATAAGVQPDLVFGPSAAPAGQSGVGAPPPAASAAPAGAAPATGAGAPPPATAAPAPGAAPGAAPKVASKLDQAVPGWFVDPQGNLVNKK